MPHIQDMASKALQTARPSPNVRPSQSTAPVQQSTTVQAPVASSPSAAVFVPNKAAFDRLLNRQPAQQNLLDPGLLNKPLEQALPADLQQQSNLMPKPAGLMASRTELTGQQGYAAMNDQELTLSLMRGENSQGKSRYTGILRGANEIAASGILDDAKLLDSRKITPPASEYDRSPADDAVLVLKDFAKMNPEQIADLKEQAYRHPEVAAELEGAIAKKHYGSPRHQAFGALVEKLTGGILSAEEAMSMCPCGGIPGDGAKEIPLISTLDPIARHAMRHDATGFLSTRFEVGPGYGTKTTIFGREKNDPLAGQILGVAREIFNPSELPDGSYAARPERFA